MTAPSAVHLPSKSAAFTLLCCPRNCMNYINRLPLTSRFCWVSPVGICSRRWEGRRKGRKVGGQGIYSLCCLPSGPLQVNCVPQPKVPAPPSWPTACDSFQFPLTSPSPCPFGPDGVIASLTAGSGLLHYLRGAICFLGH